MKTRINKIALMTTLVSALILTFTATAQVSKDTSVYKGTLANFSGNVWVRPLAKDTVKHWMLSEVMFEKGVYSNWHTHPGKMVIVATEGIGYLKEKGNPIRVLHPGDVITVEPGVLHWHGATQKSGFTQIVTNLSTDKGIMTWFQKVTNEEYQSGK